jgi:hypothetical protein
MEYTWVISAIERKLKEGELEDVVYLIHWRLALSNGLEKEEEIKVDTYGCLTLGSPSIESFTPYDEITKDQVIGWLESNLDVQNLKNKLDKQFDDIINPATTIELSPFKD